MRIASATGTRHACWFGAPSMIGYVLYVDLFAGTLRGIERHVDYLTELGVRYVHLMPLLRPRDGEDDGDEQDPQTSQMVQNLLKELDQRDSRMQSVTRRPSPSHRIRRPCKSNVVPLPPAVSLTSSGASPGFMRCSRFRRRSTKYQ